MLTGPSFAAERALAKAGMKKEDIDLWELNEAFASVVLRFMEVLDIPHDKINVNGGAIAMGHPLGATGAMILAPPRRDGAARRGHGPCHALHRRRHGHGDDSRTGLTLFVMAGL